MTSAASAFGCRSEFDLFLFAPVGEEKPGMLLSVLSALARLDLDPWQEAATLTRMPAQDATARLTLLLSFFPSDAAIPSAPSTIARSISLLPQPPLRDRLPRETSLGGSTARYWIVALYFIMALVLTLTEQFAEGRHVPAPTESGSPAHASETGPSPKSEPGPVRGPVTFRPKPTQDRIADKRSLVERRMKRKAVYEAGGRVLTKPVGAIAFLSKRSSDDSQS